MNSHLYNLFAPFNTESGRTDVVFAVNEFVFTPTSKSAFKNFTIVDDNVLEFDELFIAEFHFDYYYSYGWNVIKGEPSTAFILIEDDDSELCSDSTKPQQSFHTIFYYNLYFQVPTSFLSILLPLQLLR